jgi:hypothetical protein
MIQNTALRQKRGGLSEITQDMFYYSVSFAGTLIHGVGVPRPQIYGILCEEGSEFSASKQCRKFLNWSRNYWLFKNNSAHGVIQEQYTL